MKITVGDAGEVKVVRIEGELDSQTSPDAEAQLTQLIDAGVRKVNVNFERLFIGCIKTKFSNERLVFQNFRALRIHPSVISNKVLFSFLYFCAFAFCKMSLMFIDFLMRKCC